MLPAIASAKEVYGADPGITTHTRYDMENADGQQHRTEQASQGACILETHACQHMMTQRRHNRPARRAQIQVTHSETTTLQRHLCQPKQHHARQQQRARQTPNRDRTPAARDFEDKTRKHRPTTTRRKNPHGRDSISDGRCDYYIYHTKAQFDERCGCCTFDFGTPERHA